MRLYSKLKDIEALRTKRANLVIGICLLFFCPVHAAETQEKDPVLLRFQQAQKDEVRALHHRQQFEMRDLDFTRRLKQRKLEADAVVEKDKFFRQNSLSGDRRNYLLEEARRKRENEKAFLMQKQQLQQLHQKQFNSLMEKQKEKLKTAKEYLDRGEEFPPTLWP